MRILSGVAPFHYMVWAKAHAGAARFNLGASGLSHPVWAELGVGALTVDLLQRGAEMPAQAHARVAERCGVATDELMLTLGSSHGLYLLCAALLRPGDLCLVERPTYELLMALPRLFGARVGRIERRLEDGYRLPTDLVYPFTGLQAATTARRVARDSAFRACAPCSRS